MWRVSGKRREFKVRGIRGSVDTPVGNSTTNFEGGHFSLKGERGRQLKITPVGPPSRLKADQSLGYGLIESRRAGRCGMVGLIAAHHLPTLQRSTSLLRDLYAVSSRARTHARTHVYPLRRALLFAASRIKLEGVSAILNFLLNPCQRVFSRTLEDLLSPLPLSTPSVYPSPRSRSSTLLLPPFLPFARKDREICEAYRCQFRQLESLMNRRLSLTRARRSWRTIRMLEYDTDVNVCLSFASSFYSSMDTFFLLRIRPPPTPLSLLRFMNRIEKFACTRQRFTT